MDLNFMTEYINLVIMGICLCTGYVVKTTFNQINNKYIPFIVFILGIVLAIISDIQNINLELILTGMMSGLASTGCYELFKHTIVQTSEEE